MAGTYMAHQRMGMAGWSGKQARCIDVYSRPRRIPDGDRARQYMEGGRMEQNDSWREAIRLIAGHGRFCGLFIGLRSLRLKKGVMTVCHWLPFSEKTAPKNRHEVLCAWKTGNRWTYAVLIHWPDGLWTDETENELQPEMGDAFPLLWMDIPAPSKGKVMR